MIAGIGTDLCDVRRIEAALRKHGMRFPQRVLGADELLVFERRLAASTVRGHRFLATRFAAKEAFSKAIGLGMHMPMTWRNCQILNNERGQPVIRLGGPLAPWFAERGWRAHVTLTDEGHYAQAFVVVEQDTPSHHP